MQSCRLTIKKNSKCFYYDIFTSFSPFSKHIQIVSAVFIKFLRQNLINSHFPDFIHILTITTKTIKDMYKYAYLYL